MHIACCGRVWRRRVESCVEGVESRVIECDYVWGRQDGMYVCMYSVRVQLRVYILLVKSTV